MHDHVTALIPLAGGGGRVGLIEAGPPAAEDRSLHPSIADLIDVALYEAGQRALSAVDGLRRAARSRLSEFGRRPRSSSLRAADLRGFAGLSPENGRSAELALALALLAREGAARRPVFAATGLLRAEDAVGAADQPVAPVGGLGEKLRGLAEFLESNRGGPWDAQILLLTPERTTDGALVADRHRIELDLLGDRVQHRPIATLRAAAEAIGAEIAPRGPLAPWALPAAIGSISAGAAAILFGLWLSAPAALSFAPVIGPNGARYETPARTRTDRQNGGAIVLPTCYSEDGLRQLAYGDEVLLRLEIDTVAPQTAWRGALVAATESGELLVLGEEAFGRGAEQPGVGFTVRIPIISQRGAKPQTRLLLAMLARKLTAIDVDALRVRLRKAMDEATAGARLRSVASALSAADVPHRAETFDIGSEPLNCASGAAADQPAAMRG